MPSIDLHRHLEGAIRPSTVLEVAVETGHPLARRYRPRDAFVVDGPVGGLLPYLTKVDAASSVLRDLEDWHRVGREVVEDAYNDGLDYLELRFSPFFISKESGLRPEAVAEAIGDAVQHTSRVLGLPVGMIGIILRDLGPEAAKDQLALIRSKAQIFCAIDIAGDERGVPAEVFAKTFKAAKEAGLRLTAHAGEAAGPESVRAAFEHLGVERIGHGVRAAEDPRLLEDLASAGVVLEVALTSNLHTGAATSYPKHPIHELIAAGVPVTLNTDDPTASNITLSHEHNVAISQVGLSDASLIEMAWTSVSAAFAPTGLTR